MNDHPGLETKQTVHFHTYLCAFNNIKVHLFFHHPSFHKAILSTNASCAIKPVQNLVSG